MDLVDRKRPSQTDGCSKAEKYVWMNGWIYEWEREREREIFYLTTHSTHFIYGYMTSDIWLRTILIVRMETRCRHIGYSYRLTARVLLYAPSHRQDNTYQIVEHWLEWEIAHPMKDRSDDPPHHERTLYLWATSRSLFMSEWLATPQYTVGVGHQCQTDL